MKFLEIVFVVLAALALAVVIVHQSVPVPFALSEAPVYCEGMARPSDKAECPPANPPKQQEARVKTVGGEICWAEGGDCVEFMLHNRAAYCVWASDMAAVGSWFRRDKHLTLNQTLDQLQPQMKRPLTPNEVKHIKYWLTWGWIVGGVRDEHETRKQAEAMCRRGEADADNGAGLPGGVGSES